MTMARLIQGDCIEAMRGLIADGVQVDAIVTDPPYHFGSIVSRLGKPNSAPIQHGTDGVYNRASRGFMGKEWDGGDIAFQSRTWQHALMMLKPGGYLVVFGGTKGFHRVVCAIEDAGAEIRDTVQWMYGQGFPKSHNQGGGTEGDDTTPALLPAAAGPDWTGWGTALKPAMELVCIAQRPFKGSVASNLARHGVGAINIDACRVPADDNRTFLNRLAGDRSRNDYRTGTTTGGSVATDQGRWPANVAHDGSPEVLEAFARHGDDKGAQAPVTRRGSDKFCRVYGAFAGEQEAGATFQGDTGTAARFFYCAKATTAERIYRCKECGAHTIGTKPPCGHKDIDSHPTVKPIALMRWLCRMVTPRGGYILDPFAGTGTTGAAAIAEGFYPLLIERDPDYVADIRLRLGGAIAA